MSNPIRWDFFLAHASADKNDAEILYDELDAHARVFLDLKCLIPGDDWDRELSNAQRASLITVVLVSPRTDSAYYAREEIHSAISMAREDSTRHRVIPVYLAGFDSKSDSIPYGLRLKHGITVTVDGGLSGVAAQLRNVLERLSKAAPPDNPNAATDAKRDRWFLAHPYPMPPNFTGRVLERSMLSNWLTDVRRPVHPLLVLRALGGFGKSALTWHWIMNDVDPANWPRLVWWSFYEGDAGFDSFVRATLEYLTNVTLDPSSARGRPWLDEAAGAQLTKMTDRDAGDLGPRQQLDALLRLLRQPGTLLVLDGFERVLRAFSGLDAAYQGDATKAPSPFQGEGWGEVSDPPPSPLAGRAGVGSHSPSSFQGEGRGAVSNENERDCVSPLAELFLRSLATLPEMHSKVLLTTRLRPRAVETRGGERLQGCREEELNQLKPADAALFFHAQGVRGTHAEIESACGRYGYHPLSLRLLAGVIVRDFRQPGDIAAASRLDVSGDLIQRQHHVLETAYDSLTPARRALLSYIACFRSPVGYEALKALGTVVEGSSPSPLAGRAGEGSFDDDLHDLVARGLLNHDRKASRFDLHPIVRRYAYDRLTAPDRVAAHTRLRDYFAAVPRVEKVMKLEDLTPVIELYHHMVRAGQLDNASQLYYDRLNTPLYYQLGTYPLVIDLLNALFPDGEHSLPRLKNESAQGFTMNTLALAYSLAGQPRRAVPLFEQDNAIRERLGDKKNLAIGLSNVASMAQIYLGALRAADANQRRCIALCREIEDQFWGGHQELGRLLTYRGKYAESETALATALKIGEQQNNAQGQGLSWSYRALRELLQLRGDSPTADRRSALAPARRALELADETARTLYPHERDYVRAHWLLCAAHRVAGQPGEAERHLNEALERCRRINLVESEADILIDLARLRFDTGATDEAQGLAEEALAITERCGYVLQGADARLELAKLALRRGDKPTALEHATEAKRLAFCDGPPDYTYKAAYDEAEGLLRQLTMSGQ